MFTTICRARIFMPLLSREIISRNVGSFKNNNSLKNNKYSILFNKFFSNENVAKRVLAIGGVVGITTAVSVYYSTSNFTVLASSDMGSFKPTAKPIRKIKGATDIPGLKLTLYQYQSCPFCCKVRAFLDFHGFSYDVVEVNSLRRSEIKFSKYKKVPILVCNIFDEENPDDFLQINDSSVIVSILGSFLEDRSQKLQEIIQYYPVVEVENKKGKMVFDFPNKYFIMYGERLSAPKNEKIQKWREWTDSTLVHTLSPNIYRTPGEAIETFRYFSKVGEWDRAFSWIEKNIVIFVGAASMYFIGKMLKKRHNLNDDVRISMYNACHEWTTFLAGQEGQFMGGNSPNIADLAVFGVLSAIEGTDAFRDIQQNTNISDWYFATKVAVQRNAGKPENNMEHVNRSTIPIAQ